MTGSSGGARRAQRWVFVSLGLLATCWPALALAQSDDERARFHFQAGRSYFEQARYEDSVREWEESYRLSGRHVLLVNIAEAQERLFQFGAAVASLERYLELGGEEAAASRTTIQSRISRLRRLAAEYRAGGGGAGGEPGAEPAGGGESAGEGGEELAAGDGQAGSGEGEGGAGEGGAGEGGSLVAPRRAGWTWAWVALGATAAFTAVAITTGAFALIKRNSCSPLPSSDGVRVCPDQRTIDVGTRLAVTTDVFIGLASAAAIATVLLFLLEPRAEAPAAASVAPWIGAGGGGLAAAFAF